ncbi:MAG: sigma 54-interacting transcriptional regulator [Myxococcota bacterium]
MAEQTVALEGPAKGAATLALAVVEGPDQGTTFTVEGEHTLGSSERADFVLTDRAVSRRHLLVRAGAVGLELVDAESRNGTWLGRTRVYRADLGEGESIRIGGTTLRVIEGARADVAPAESRRAYGRFVGASPSLARLYRALEAAAPTDATVLFEGESGTGKELLSEAVHDHSPRRDGPFVVVDCGSIPERLIESELFGHVRGAFTGAAEARTGAFERAHGGTVFLDEIGELPLAMQSRLLRVLDGRQVRRVGSSDWKSIDIRVVAATNRNLEKEVEEGRFRLDLFHRLAVMLLRVPPLRSRLDDLDLLVPALLKGLGAQGECTPDLLQRLRSHPWPGNVRELRNYLERFSLLGELELHASTATPDDGIDAIAVQDQPFRVAKAKALERFTALYVEHMLQRHGGNVSHAAEAAGVARRHFQRLKSTKSGS